MIYIGIDNGTSGAMVAMDEKSYILAAQPVFTIELGKGKSLDVDKNLDWICQMRSVDEVKVAFEQTQINPIFGSKNNFNSGRNNEFWRVLLTMSQIPFMAVNPKVWQKVIFNGMRGGKKSKDTKAMAALVRRQLFPRLTTNFKKDETLGINDALCIALWAKQTL